MAFDQHQLVLVDANVIIEAYRTGCWAPLADYFRLCTVEKVVEETQTGYQNRRKESWIDQAQLVASLHHVQPVTEAQRLAFNEKYNHPALDAGEKDLLIYAETLSDAWLLNSPDVAAIRFANQKDWLDRLVSLEAMNGHLKTRLKETLRNNYTEGWLVSKRTDFRLGLG